MIKIIKQIMNLTNRIVNLKNTSQIPMQDKYQLKMR